ncbi:hypothetical protein [Dactylosporangium sp. NPDC051484]|uniref:hypothetical protein n=1 Tax=Dactylosporangium sp. NPDC051484 TaxID=3154942 RepID=UPI00344C5016
MLAVIDISATMKSPASSAGGLTKEQVAVQAAHGGRDNDPSGLSLDALISSLQQAERADQPVQIIIIGVGTEVDEAKMRRIVDATGGAVFVASDPSTIGAIFMKALALDDGR